MSDGGGVAFHVAGRVRQPAKGWGPWTGTDILRLALTAGLGVVLLATAWYGSANVGTMGAQMPWMDLGVVGAILFGVGNCVWLVQGRKRIGERRSRLIPFTAEEAAVYRWRPAWAGPGPAVVANGVATAGHGAPLDDNGLVTGPGMRLAHRPSCPLVADKETTRVRRRNLALCRVCHPDQP